MVSVQKRSECLLNVSGKIFITDPKDEAYNGYLGTYFAIFRSTSPFEEKWLSRKITISPSGDTDSFCKVSFELDTGERDKKGHPVIKCC